MRFGRNRMPHEASFDLTPMVDVVLLLIIFFTMTTHFAKTQLAPIELSREPGDKAPVSEQSSIIIDLRADGSMSVLGAGVGMPELVRMVQSETQRSPKVDVVIRAERHAPARHLNDLAGALAGAGVREWKLATAGEASF
jgi:biopolymer transport protein ExbD